MTSEDLANFNFLSKGLNPTQFIEKLSGMGVKEAKDYIPRFDELFGYLDRMVMPSNHAKIISEHEDRLKYRSRGYGDGKAPQDYLAEFSEFINNNMNTIVALKVICTRPHELTRESLISLKQELDRNHFTEKQLNTAWHELKNEDVAADIISHIRRCALGSPLISHEERVKAAVNKLRKSFGFTKMELDWLVKIEKTLLNESVIDRETFDAGALKTAGGFNKADKVFGGKLDIYLHELNSYLYNNGGNTA